MQLMTFNEVLTFICDSFDDLIAPRSIARSNTNIIYLILKAVSKGYEVINNVCVVLNNKFDPANCSVEDLHSVASLVGTEYLKGSGSGLNIVVTNTSELPATLYAGFYSYKLDDDTTFVAEVLENTEIPVGGYVDIIAMTEKIGSYHVTAQSSIDIITENITDNLKFSCTDNANLLGTDDESDLEFRKRILSDDNRQNGIIELQTKLKNLPYIFDCRCKFNPNIEAVEYDGYTIPSGYLAIFYSGAPRNEMAKIIASKIMCSTVETEDSVTVTYDNEVFVNSEMKFNLIPFKKAEFDIKVRCNINTNIISEENAIAEISRILFTAYTPQVHVDYIKENDAYNYLNSIDLNGVELLGLDLIYNGEVTDYIEVPLSRIPSLREVKVNED